MPTDIRTDIEVFFKGDIADDEKTLTHYSRDASLVRVRPSMVLFPKDVGDVKALVAYVNKHKAEHPELSLTGRSAGTDMTGGPLSESLVLDFTRYFKREEVDEENLRAIVEPGVFYRDFETITLPKHISFPVFPASKQLAALGGMIMNNAAGEKTLRYGQVRDFVEEISMVLSDGNEYAFKKLSKQEWQAKIAQNNFEGDLYKKVHDLVTICANTIEHAKPKTSKNSSGYALWRVWDNEKETLDLGQLFVGSQGTLGLFSKAQVRLVKDKPYRALVALFFKSWDSLPAVVNATLPHDPESMEVFDDTTMKLGIRFMPEIAKAAHESFLRFASRFLPEVWISIKMFRIPKLVVLIELAEESQEILDQKITQVTGALKGFPLHVRVLTDAQEAEKYWVMRRESFNLLRQHVHGKSTAPFIEDFAIDPALVPEFLPRVLKILKDNGIKANIAGHAGNGNYHIIPLMDMTDPRERAKIVPVAKKIYDLIISHGGTITAEHNDGIVRTPFVEQMFGHDMYVLFEETKRIFDPHNIFNPGKKVGGTIEYLESHIAK